MEARVLVGDQVNAENTEKPFLTHSTWQSYLSCPAAFYMDYFMKIESPKNFALGFGSAWDNGLNEYAELKMQDKLHLDDVVDVFTKSYKTETVDSVIKEKDLFTDVQKAKLVEKYGEIPVEEIAKKTDEHKNFWKKWGEQRIKDYHTNVGQYIKPIATQQKFYIDFGPNTPFGYKGTMDRIDEGGIVIDNKTSKSRWNSKDLLNDLQGVGYSLAYRVMNPGKVEKRVQFDVMVKTKTQSFNEQFQQIVMGIEEHKFDLLLQEISNVYRMLMQGILYRNVAKFTASCSWCEHRKHCWQPSKIWSRPGEEAKLVNWHEIGEEFRKNLEQNPKMLQFWY